MPRPSPVPPPRVSLIDPATGLISREWFLYLINQYQLTEETSALQLAPLGASNELAALSTDIQGALTTASLLDAQIAQLQRQLDDLKVQIVPQLGTMAALQQANLPWTTFSPAPQSVPEATPGTLYWNSADNAKTLNLVMEDSGGVIQQIGEETYYRVKASSAITNGQVVMFDGTLGASGGLKGRPATGLTATQSEYVMGVATQDIALNGWGYVTWFGEIKGVNTTGALYGETWADGDILYFNPAYAGGLTKTVPVAPNPKVIVASVIHAATNGVLFVRPTFGSALGATDSNVQITSLADKDLLQYNATNLRWENVSPASIVSGSAPVTKTADFTVAASETWLINNKSGSTCTVTLPTAASNTGRTLTFQNYQSQLLVSASSNVVPLAGGAAGTAILAASSGDWATMVSNGTNWVIMQAAPNNALLLE